MAKKQTKPKTVVLPSGETILEEPPSEWYPSGKKILVSEPVTMRDKLLEQMDDLKEKHQEIHQRNAELLQAKRDSLADNPSVPPEKRPV